ncbi:MAG: NAD-dependent epimerase/dehydratase family protein, partial [Calditrichia bacterium]|nr:NAD-dependent epimerase/dehydratase family protein [Calditrichia bacterium]
SYYSAVIPKFIQALLEGKAPVIFGDGEQSRDFTYIDNVVNANLLACKAPKAAGQMMNLACGDRMTLNELAKNLQDILQIDIDPVYEPPRAGDIKHSLSDITKAKELLGFEVVVPLYEGLKKTALWFKDYYNL